MLQSEQLFEPGLGAVRAQGAVRFEEYTENHPDSYHQCRHPDPHGTRVLEFE